MFSNTKTVILMRHANAPFAGGCADIDRPLDDEGIKQALDTGTELAKLEINITPDLVLCSPAQRTKQTFNLVGQNWSALANVKQEFPDALYDASAGDLLAQLQSLPEDVRTVMIFGHNPGISAITNLLWDAQMDVCDDMMIMVYPPATCTVLQRHEVAHRRDSSWESTAPRSFSALHFSTP